MKNADRWSLVLFLLFLQLWGLQGQEASLGDEVARLIREADDVRVVHVNDTGRSKVYTAYQSLLPAENKALAQVFADATWEPLRFPDGSNDPGGLGVSSYTLINARKKGQLVSKAMFSGYLVLGGKLEKIWCRATYKDAPWSDDTVPAEKSFMENRVLGIIQASVNQGGGWKKVEGSLKGFLNVELPD